MAAGAHRAVVAFIAVALTTAVQPAGSQTYPSKPVRLVVPAAVSTPIDIISRVVADKVGAQLGQPVVVESKPGATGAVGAQEVLKQPADGYTLMTLHMPMSVAQTLYSNVPFDLRRDFAPIGQTAWSYNVLVVYPAVKADSVKDLIDLLKGQPGKLSFSSGGPGTPAHVSGELFKMQAGVEAMHVPYNQFPQAIADLLSGQNQFMFAAAPPMMPHIAAGKLRALAVTGPKRIAALPDVPTMMEAGFPDFVVRDWQGFVAKAGTPPEVIERVNAAIARALQTDEAKSVFAKLGADAAAGSPDDFARLISAEIERWSAVVRVAKLRVE